jgi:hypothetical protein
VKPELQVHAAGTELESGEFELVGHARHVAATVAATVVEYFAAVQSRHRAVPVMILYFPAAQAVHVPPFGPVKPILQRQAVTATLAAGELESVGHERHTAAAVAPTVVEYVLTPQLVHASEPVVVLYFPATQFVQAAPLGPVEPRLQVQLASVVPALPEFAGHAVHVPPLVP